MDGPEVTMQVRHVADAVAVVDIKGEVTAGLRAGADVGLYEEAGGPGAPAGWCSTSAAWST